MGNDMNNLMAGLPTDERRQKILELIDAQGKVKVEELSRIFAVSNVSIRMDLNELEARGLIKRIHGGAIQTHERYFDRSFQNTMKAQAKEKQRIAERTAALISDSDLLFVNAGTTGIYVLRALTEVQNLTVVTNSVLTAQEASYFSNIQVYLLGGAMDHNRQVTWGENTITQIGNFYVDKAILSVGGIDTDMGITTRYHQEAAISKAMIEHARRTLVVAAGGKVGNISSVRISPLEFVDTLVTDDGVLDSYVDSIRAAGVEVHLA